MRSGRGLVLGLLLAGCAPDVRVVPVPVDLTGRLPVRPVLPTVTAEEVACLTEPAYQRLYDRQRLLREYAEQCEAIVKATGVAPPVRAEVR